MGMNDACIRIFSEQKRFPAWLNGPITWLWLWQNYLAVHHLFPRVPFYRYAALFDRIRSMMVARGAPIQQIG